MAQRYGGKIVTDGLVLCLDAHDAKSYAGEPVTNLVTSSAVDFSVRSAYSGNTFSQVVDNESPSGYACEMSYTGTVNSSSRSRFGAATNIPTSGTGFVSIWAKKSAGPSTTMRPAVYTGYTWYILDPLDGGSSYLTEEYRPFGKAVNFGTASAGPNPGFSMTYGGNTTANDKTRWIKPQVTTLSYNVPFANLSRSATNGWVDRSGNSNDGTLVNGTNTGVSHYRNGEVIMPVANSYLDFDGTDNYVSTSFGDDHNPATNPISYTLWVKTHTNSGSKMFLVQSDWGGNHRAYFGTISGECGMGIQSSGWGSTQGGDTITTNTWNHMCIVFEGLTCKWYRNGSLMFSKSYTSFTFSQNLSIGSARPYSTSYDWDGEIAQVLVHNKALTAAEVLNNYNTTKSRFL